jgi:serine phosphatase RsbU (regulator of sigma subunit)
MAVLFIVGALHALVEHISGPAALLAELNKRLLGRLENGFTTCLALRLEQDGRCAIAGAGHPAPFIGDQEIQIKSGLPLGLFRGEVYEEVEFILHPGETCMLYTDGLTEARNKNGELFGEERLAKLFAAWPTAKRAAEAAIQFGQDDDVTVVSFTRLNAEAISAEFVETAVNRVSAIEPKESRAL